MYVWFALPGTRGSTRGAAPRVLSQKLLSQWFVVLQVPFGRVEKATSKSAWCAAFAPDLSSANAWWLCLRYLVAAIQVHR